MQPRVVGMLVASAVGEGAIAASLLITRSSQFKPQPVATTVYVLVGVSPGRLTGRDNKLIDRPDVASLHLLLELDRGTEDRGRLLMKARRYAKAVPRSPLADADLLTLIVVPSDRRARTVAATLADGPWPMAIEPWSPGGESPLDLTVRATGGVTSR
jgi:hypothetical protein